jgi:hypothetical protein
MPNFPAISPFSSARRVNGRFLDFLKSFWFSTASPLMPTTSTSLPRVSASSRKPQACRVQPPVRAAGKK